jgi:outer membrane protein TolC
MGFWLALAMFGMSNQSGPLTVDEAVRIAEQNAFSVQISQTRVARNAAAVAEARGRLGPQVDLNASYTRFDRGTSVPNGSGGTVVVSPIDSKQAGITATLPIDISSRLSNAVHAARENLNAARENFAASGNDIKLQARQAFFNVLRSEKLVVVQQQAVTDAQANLDNVTKLEAQGLSARVDVLRAQAQVQQSKADLISAQNS